MATALDNYDTQMMDYSTDIDVQMHPSMDSWFQDEAAMEAETEATQYSSADGELVDVEVDMENPEYEMTDGAEDYPVTTEIEDAIVTDASHPVDSFDTSSPSIHDNLSLQPSSEALPETDLVAPVESDFVSLASAEMQPSQPQEVHSETADAEEVQAIDAGVSDSLDHLTAVDSTPAPLQPFEDSEHNRETSLPQTYTDIGTTVSSADQESGTLENGPEEVDSTISATVAPEPLLHADPENPLGDTPQVEDVTARAPEFETLQASEEQKAEHTAQAGETSDHVEIEERVSVPQQEAEQSQDPHEISDGVYIDPPPAVLLNLALADQRDVCLFNQPVQTDPSTSNETVQSYELLLHDYPTLYYEPLSKVFDALRNDNYLSQIDLTQTELLLDAYDLQLVVSEDNIFARETSLHDLNVLHDYSDIAGPLRLRLQTVTPRFITRYRLLQEQILRLNVSTEDYDEESNEEEQDRTSEYQQEHEQYPHEDDTRPDEQQEQEDPAPVTNNEERYADAEPVEKSELEVPKPLPQNQPGSVTTSEVAPVGDPVPNPEEEQAADNEVSAIGDPLHLAEELESNTIEASEGNEFAGSPESGETDEETKHDPNQHAGDQSSEESTSQNQEDVQDSTEVAEGVPSEDLTVDTNLEHATDDPDALSREPNSAADVASQLYTEEAFSKEDSPNQEEDYYEEWDDNSYNEEANNTVLEPEQETLTRSSTTMSDKSSKRSIQDVEEDEAASPTSSPGSKRLRTG
ncbi:hypothetical protein VKT23_017186 [Stygiomarasmius scandens]|uniref:Uncharacterized protein n=1 Tax=Marasmiellus scandens TaxID=2682957 RepID=A0ABR1IVX2_9AGAR